MGGSGGTSLGREAFRAEVSRRPIVADGGLGTSLIGLGTPVDACLEALNVRRPEIVELAHRSFVDAGARLVLTNSFGANRYRLERHGLADRVDELCAASVARARAAGADLVAGSLGPLGVRLAPYGRVRDVEAADAYAEQAAALVGAGADLLVLETQTDLREIEVAVQAVRGAVGPVVLIVSATFIAGRPHAARLVAGGRRGRPHGARRRRGRRELRGRACAGAADRPRDARDRAPGFRCSRAPTPAAPPRGRQARVSGDAWIRRRGGCARSSTPARPIVGGCCGTGPSTSGRSPSRPLARARRRATVAVVATGERRHVRRLRRPLTATRSQRSLARRRSRRRGGDGAATLVRRAPRSSPRP